MLARPLKVYLDTSILNFAVSAQDVPCEKEATLQLFEEIKKGRFLAYISQVTLEEIHRAGEEKRNELIKVVRQINPEELVITEEAVTLATHYIESKIIPANQRNDALHIAIATVHNLDVI